MKQILILTVIVLLFHIKPLSQTTVSDYDGNIYELITIGNQTWLKENLKTTRFNDGTEIPLISDNNIWQSLSSSGYSFYNNDESTYKQIYGALYNWYTVETGKICPTECHVPNDFEWTTLINYLGGQNIAGGKLKEVGSLHWSLPNVGATNEVSFTALPGGFRGSTNGTYGGDGLIGWWWSATESSTNIASYMSLGYDDEVAYSSFVDKKNGLSVRCICDLVSKDEIIDPYNLIHIFPNPATEIIYIENSYNSNGIIQVYNSQGICKLTENIKNGINIIDVGLLNEGFYLINITIGNNMLKEKLIIK